MIIKDTYIDGRGNTFNIRNIHFYRYEDTSGNLGVFVNESHPSNPEFSDSLSDGIYLYKSYYDSKKALRIYKDFTVYNHTGHNDQKMIIRLQKKQKDVKLTEFPTGIITIGNKIIGQEVPYYENYETLRNIFGDKLNKKIPTHYYIEILKIIKELYNAGIVYQDIHTKNLLCSLVDENIKLIDFDPWLIKFDDDIRYGYNSMINNLKSMIKRLNKLSGIEFASDFESTNTLEEVEECVLENHIRLK